MDFTDLLLGDNDNILGGKGIGVEHKFILAKESIINIVILFLFIYIVIKIGQRF